MSRRRKSDAAPSTHGRIQPPAPPSRGDGQLKIVRNDDLIEAQKALHAVRPPRERGGLSKGWLGPQICWALYKQFGVIRQLLGKVANQCVAKGWQWTKDGVDYDWSSVASELEALRFQAQLKKAIKWAHVEGGGGLVFRLDEVQRPDIAPEAAEVVDENVRGISKIEVYTATQLRPLASDGQPGHWDTADRFQLQNTRRRGEVIHRSRIVPIVVDDIPMDSGVATMYSSTTGWPPSWLDGVIDSLQSWRDAESTVDNLLFTISLLILELEGAREAMTSPHENERKEFADLVQAIANTLSSHGILALPRGDKLGEIGRNTGGVDKLVRGKQDTFVADTGFSAERVLQRVTTGLGDTSHGPRLNDHETIEGLQEQLCGPAIDRATEFHLMGVRHRALALGEAVDLPEKWVVEFNSLATQSAEEKANTRVANSRARANDLKAGVPQEAVASDPELDEHYPGLAELREAEALAQEAAASEPVDPSQPPDDETLMSAAAIGAKLGVSASSVKAMRRRGLIRGWNFGGRWRFSWKQVKAALASELGALEKAGGAVGDAARRSRLKLKGDIKIDAGDWAILEPAVVGDHLDALPPGMSPSTSSSFGSMYGASDAMREVFAVLERVAPTDIPVLILGETGTGKEGAARGLHDVPGRKGPFVAVNCATLGDDADAVAAQLLGDGQQPGLFEQAHGGTLFLDEVGELSEEGQAVLLRALGGDVRRVRGTGPIEVRAVSATWREIGIPGACKFRRDLYERLAGVVVELPPLRERDDDVLELAQRFLTGAAEEMGVSPAPTLSGESKAVLRAHAWPGNIRELKNAIRRAVIFAGPGAAIEPEHLQLHVGRVP